VQGTTTSRVGCYIWYSEKGPGRATVPPSPLFAVPNVKAVHPSTASVPITVLMMVRSSAVLMWRLKALRRRMVVAARLQKRSTSSDRRRFVPEPHWKQTGGSKMAISSCEETSYYMCLPVRRWLPTCTRFRSWRRSRPCDRRGPCDWSTSKTARRERYRGACRRTPAGRSACRRPARTRPLSCTRSTLGDVAVSAPAPATPSVLRLPSLWALPPARRWWYYCQ